MILCTHKAIMSDKSQRSSAGSKEALVEFWTSLPRIFAGSQCLTAKDNAL